MGCGPCWVFVGSHDAKSSKMSSHASSVGKAPAQQKVETEVLLCAVSSGKHGGEAAEEEACAKSDSTNTGQKIYQHPSLHRLDPTRVAEVELRLQSVLADTADSTELDLSSLDLWSVPPAVLTRPQLRELTLKNNCILELPPDIAVLTALTKLDVSRNRLRVLPEAVGELRGLRELNVMTNHLLKLQHSVPLAAFKKLTSLELLDVRFNPKLTSATLEEVLTAHVPDGCKVLLGGRPTQPQLPAGELDATLLRSQLEPWSTSAMRRRLAEEFGIDGDLDETDREVIFKLLLDAYAVKGPRALHRVPGIALPPNSEPLLDELLEKLRGTAFPTGEKRERLTIQAHGYIILRRPLLPAEEDADDNGEPSREANTKRQHGMRPERPMPRMKPGVEKLGWKQRTAAAKLQQYQRVWDLAYSLVQSVDPDFAEQYTAIAMTKNFVGSPHVDTENVGPFYGISIGNFEGGGICVENTPFEVAEVDTRRKFGKVDGRFPHWVAPYTGERYSIIYYPTHGPVVPKTTAIFHTDEVF
mmetsp:Transcript_7743/g.28352  ORF Transcript_7743/g.28352 Transcript_7743/m.28352 type:complete len:528 (+) Transcript_7743:142-1725(+)